MLNVVMLFVGTLWVGEIVWLIMNNVNIELANEIHNRLRVMMIEACRGDTNWNVDQIREQPAGNRVLSTHLLPKFFKNLRDYTSVPKIIVILRNPKDTLVSFFHFYRANESLGKFPGDFHEFFKLFEAQTLAFGDIFEHTIAWFTHPLKDHFLFVTYEEMKDDVELQIKRLCGYLNKSLTPEQIEGIIQYSSFEQMKNCPSAKMVAYPATDASVSPYVRKGEVGDWKNYMTQEESDKIDTLYKEKLLQIGVKYRFE